MYWTDTLKLTIFRFYAILRIGLSEIGLFGKWIRWYSRTREGLLKLSRVMRALRLLLLWYLYSSSSSCWNCPELWGHCDHKELPFCLRIDPHSWNCPELWGHCDWLFTSFIFQFQDFLLKLSRVMRALRTKTSFYLSLFTLHHSPFTVPTAPHSIILKRP